MGLTRPYQWWICDDVWVPYRPAGFIVDGAAPYLYEGDSPFVYPPGLALLYAPIVVVARWFALADSGVASVQRPTAWFLVAPVGIGLSALPLRTLRAYVWDSG